MSNISPLSGTICTRSETNLSEVERTLRSLIGKGDVQVRLMNGNWMNGEVEA